MLSGYYAISSGLLTRQRELDTIGNNLVNARTPGYQAQRTVSSTFDMELLIRQEGGKIQLGPGYASVEAIVDDVLDIYGGGSITETGVETDMAIGGEGFFNIIGEDGNRYLTRNGSFHIDAEGYLELEGYGRVSGTNGQALRVGPHGFYVNHFGEVFNVEGQAVGTLQITAPNEGEQLARMDNGLFQLENGQGRNAEDYQIVQRSIELSNVDLNREMTYLIESQRAFQNCGSALQIIDSMNQKAATRIASV